MCVEGPIFHFHDYGRKSINPQSELVETTVGLHKTSLPRVRNVDQLSCSNGFVHQLQMTSQEFPLHQTKEQAVPPASSVSSEKSGRFYSPKALRGGLTAQRPNALPKPQTHLVKGAYPSVCPMALQVASRFQCCSSNVWQFLLSWLWDLNISRLFTTMVLVTCCVNEVN